MEKIGILDFAVHTVAVHDSIHSKYVQCWDLRYTYIRLVMSAHACVCESAVNFRKLGPVSFKVKSVTCNVREVITRYDYS